MRIAVISDIHSNFKALEAFLSFLEEHPVDGVICLGDYVTDGPYPERTLALVHGMSERYPCYLLRGNREDYLLQNLDNHLGWKPSSNSGALLYTLNRLGKEELDFLGSLPTEREVSLAGCPALFCCHGVPGRVRGNTQEERGLKQKALRELPGRFLLGGHSHHQEIYRQEGKTYLNPGSLGLALDGVGRRAHFAVLSGDAKAIAKAPGVGAKTAQRAILELKDKLSLEDALEKQLEHGSSSVPPSKNPVKNEAVMALTALGYSSSESLKAVSKVEITPETDVEEVLRQALKNMI